jgi:hypothetical protein
MMKAQVVMPAKAGIQASIVQKLVPAEYSGKADL